MVIIKLVALVLAAISITKSYLDYRKKLEPMIMFVFWTVVWLVAATIVVYPLLIDKVIAYTQVRTITVSSLTGLGFIFMLYIIYRIYAKAARIEHQQIQLIRKLGLDRIIDKRK